MMLVRFYTLMEDQKTFSHFLTCVYASRLFCQIFLLHLKGLHEMNNTLQFNNYCEKDQKKSQVQYSTADATCGQNCGSDRLQAPLCW